MTNSEYWKKRAEERKNHVSRTADEAAEEARESFERARHRTNREVAYWIQKFADAEGISYDEARKMLEAGELEQFRMTLREYIARGKALDVDPEWQDAMVKASALHHIDRLNALKTIIRAELEENKARLKRSQWMHDIADYSYEHTLFGIETGLEMQIRFRQPDLDRLHRDIEEAWAPDGIDFVDRVGINNDKLAAEVDRLLTQGMITGETYEELAKQLTDQFALKEYEAARIIRTEATRVASMSEVAAYRTAGLEEYEILVTLDERTCSICGPMDGHVERVDDMEPGVTAPPFHPNCRCTTIGHYEDGLIDETRIARDEDGNPIHVDGDMTWEEWQSVYAKREQMAAELGENDWTGAEPRNVSKEEKKALIEYTKSKGVNAVDFSKFDGEPELLKAQIDTVSDLIKDFPTGKTVTVTVANLDKEDFAEIQGRTIKLNNLALRNRTITEHNLQADGAFAATRLEDIAAHEYGHLFAKSKGINGLDIVSEAYYNKHGEMLPTDEIQKVVGEELSKYAKAKKNEIIPEIFAKNNSEPNDFSTECARLLRKRVVR